MSQMDQSALRARNILIALFGAFWILDTALVVIIRDWWAIERILFTLIAMYFALQGRRWAKWLLVSICSLLTLVLLAFLLAAGPKLTSTLDLGPQLANFLIAGSWVVMALSAAIATYLITNKDLNRYFACKRNDQSLNR